MWITAGQQQTLVEMFQIIVEIWNSRKAGENKTNKSINNVSLWNNVAFVMKKVLKSMLTINVLQHSFTRPTVTEPEIQIAIFLLTSEYGCCIYTWF